MISPRGVGNVQISGEKNMRIVVLMKDHTMELDNKIQAIKTVRALTKTGLKEAKDLVERVSPSNHEVLKVPHSILEPEFSENIRALRDSGFKIKLTDPSSKIRMGIGDELRKIVTYCTMSSQYDIAKAVIDVLETYCPEPSEETTDDEVDKEGA